MAIVGTWYLQIWVNFVGMAVEPSNDGLHVITLFTTANNLTSDAVSAHCHHKKENNDFQDKCRLRRPCVVSV